MSGLRNVDFSMLGESVGVERLGSFLVELSGGRNWAVKGDPADGWWGKVMPNGSLSESDWEHWPEERTIVCMVIPSQLR